MTAIARITGVVLAGGRSSRMGGSDKALLPFGTTTLLAQVVARFAPQVGTLLVNGRVDLSRHGVAEGCLVVDRIAGQPGPLAGIDAALAVCTTEFLVAVPCDAPFLPFDLVGRLVAALAMDDAEVAVASTAVRRHPVFVAMRPDVAASVARSIADGQRSVGAWIAARRAVDVVFADEAAFVNCNTPDELRAAARLVQDVAR